jgi:hypothetical protein
MKKISLTVALSLALMFGLALQGWGDTFTISKLNTAGAYTIDSFTNGGSVQETYSATTPVPFPSHDGFALVTPSTDDGGPIWFDKLITITSNSPNFDHFEATFHVDNNTGFSWSDYHFLLAFDDVTIPDNLQFSTPNSGDSDLKGHTLVFSGTNLVEIGFFAENPGQEVASGTGSNFHIGFDFDVPTNGSLTFELRQVATAVPLPPSAILMGSGLLGLLGFGWRRKVKS